MPLFGKADLKVWRASENGQTRHIETVATCRRRSADHRLTRSEPLDPRRAILRDQQLGLLRIMKHAACWTTVKLRARRRPQNWGFHRVVSENEIALEASKLLDDLICMQIQHFFALDFRRLETGIAYVTWD